MLSKKNYYEIYCELKIKLANKNIINSNYWGKTKY